MEGKRARACHLPIVLLIRGLNSIRQKSSKCYAKPRTALARLWQCLHFGGSPRLAACSCRARLECRAGLQGKSNDMGGHSGLEHEAGLASKAGKRAGSITAARCVLPQQFTSAYDVATDVGDGVAWAEV